MNLNELYPFAEDRKSPQARGPWFRFRLGMYVRQG